MLAGLKTHAGGLFARPLGPQRHMRGFFSDSLLRTLELLPEHLWPKSRRKRDYVSGVLARAEVGSAWDELTRFLDAVASKSTPILSSDRSARSPSIARTLSSQVPMAEGRTGL